MQQTFERLVLEEKVSEEGDWVCNVLKGSHLASFVSGGFLCSIYLTLFHHGLLAALGAVPGHDAGAQALAVARALLHGVSFGAVPAVVRGPAALRQAELLAEHAVLLLHLAHAHLQALALPLARRRVPRAVGLRLQRGQRHRLPICTTGKQSTSVRTHQNLRRPLMPLL